MHRVRIITALVGALSLCACATPSSDPVPKTSPDAGDGGPLYSYPLDDVLRINQIQTKGTHNSYHVETEGNLVQAWAYSQVKLTEQLSHQGVRSLELDVHYNRILKEFSVYHEDGVDEGTTCRSFVGCLQEIKAWSDAHPAHHVLFVQIEPKDSPDLLGAVDPAEFFGQLEGAILEVWPEERIVTPARVLGSAPGLPAALADHGWPTLGAARGRIMFAMDNATAFRDAYTHGGKDLEGRLMFVDSRVGDPFAAVAILNDPIGGADAIKGALAAGLFVRTRADEDNIEPLAGNTLRLDAALASGANVVTTDYPEATQAVAYSVQIPDGSPSRCDPVTAPKECTSRAVEDPAFIDASMP